MSDKDEREALAAAVEQLYQVFSGYPLERWNGPYCCTDEVLEDLLQTKPLRELSGADLRDYEWHAINVCGNPSVTAFKHLLPRSLELLGNGDNHTGAEVLLGKLPAAHWLAWPDEEQAAVRDFMMAVWRSLIANPDMQFELDADELLCAFARTGEDLSQYLYAWRVDDSLSSLQRFTEFVLWNYDDLVGEAKLANPFWDDSPSGMAQVVSWLLEDETLRWIKRYACDGRSEPFSRQVADAIEELADLQQRNDLRETVTSLLHGKQEME